VELMLLFGKTPTYPMDSASLFLYIMFITILSLYLIIL